LVIDYRSRASNRVFSSQSLSELEKGGIFCGHCKSNKVSCEDDKRAFALEDDEALGEYIGYPNSSFSSISSFSSSSDAVGDFSEYSSPSSLYDEVFSSVSSFDETFSDISSLFDDENDDYDYEDGYSGTESDFEFDLSLIEGNNSDSNNNAGTIESASQSEGRRVSSRGRVVIQALTTFNLQLHSLRREKAAALHQTTATATATAIDQSLISLRFDETLSPSPYSKGKVENTVNDMIDNIKNELVVKIAKNMEKEKREQFRKAHVTPLVSDMIESAKEALVTVAKPTKKRAYIPYSKGNVAVTVNDMIEDISKELTAAKMAQSMDKEIEADNADAANEDNSSYLMGLSFELSDSDGSYNDDDDDAESIASISLLSDEDGDKEEEKVTTTTAEKKKDDGEEKGALSPLPAALKNAAVAAVKAQGSSSGSSSSGGDDASLQWLNSSGISSFSSGFEDSIPSVSLLSENEDSDGKQS
jgi:hypothetical protein